MTRYLNSFFITMVLYLIAVFFLFFVFADSVIVPEKVEKSISLKHITFVQQEPTPEQPVQAEPEPVVEKPEPIIEKKKERPKKEKRPEHKKFEHKKPMHEPIKEPTQKVEEPKTEVVPQSQPVKPAENTPVAPKVDTNELENIEAQYLSKLRSQIEKNKVYPNSAKRLNQNGKVYVTFIISKDGQITNIKINKSSNFEKLDEAALKILADIGSTEPIPKELNKTSWEITVPIVYQIR